MPAPPPSFAVTGLGCKVAQYDAEAFACELEERGLVRLGTTDEADILLVNTCTVTTRADYQANLIHVELPLFICTSPPSITVKQAPYSN